MVQRGLLTKILTIIGTLLVWFPIFMTLLTSAVGSVMAGKFLLDYLMPAEFSPAAFAGGGLLVWAALRARSRRRMIVWGLILMTLLLFGGMALAELTGLASGETEPEGWALAVVLTVIAAYDLVMIWTGIAGVWLLRDVFSPAQPGGTPAAPAG